MAVGCWLGGCFVDGIEDEVGEERSNEEKLEAFDIH
jgi:hypothetical protein